jgi:hypothetical protein
MQARDIPVFGDILDAAVLYASTVARIARHPLAFVHTIGFDDPGAVRRGFKFLGAGIAVAYLILTPALSRHGFEVGELRFGFVVLVRLLLVTLLYHAAFYVFGYRRPLSASLILSSYLNGLYFPFFMLVMLPGYFAVGPGIYFDPGIVLTPDQVSQLNDTLVLTALALLLVAYPFFFAVASYWWAKAYGARLALSAALLLAALVLAGAVNIYIVPMLTRLFI